jgi:hypothetical protein
MKQFALAACRGARAPGALVLLVTSLSVAGMVGTAPEARADIVNWHVNMAVPAGFDGLYVKIDTRQVTTSDNGLPGWDINPYGLTTLNFYATATAPNPATTYVRTQGGGGPSSLAPGFLIDASSPFRNSTVAVISSTNVGANGWVLNAVNYFGFRFHNDTANAIRYGYGVMHVGATATDRTLVSLHYENTGAGINVVAVPEPGTLGLLAVGVAGLLAGRRRRTV